MIELEINKYYVIIEQFHPPDDDPEISKVYGLFLGSSVEYYYKKLNNFFMAGNHPGYSVEIHPVELTIPGYVLYPEIGV